MTASPQLLVPSFREIVISEPRTPWISRSSRSICRDRSSVLVHDSPLLGEVKNRLPATYSTSGLCWESIIGDVQSNR